MSDEEYDEVIMSDWEYDEARIFILSSAKVGLLNENPDSDLDHLLYDALDWKKLKALNDKEERDTQIVRRANLFLLYSFPPIAGQGHYFRLRVAARAKAEKAPDQERPGSVIPFPLKKLETLMLVEPHDTLLLKRPAFCIAYFPNLKSVRLHYNKVADRFHEGRLYERISVLVRELFRTKKIDKIVAFGGAHLVAPFPPDSTSAIKLHTQHAALLLMRDIWNEEQGDGKKDLPIYIQDLTYNEFDREAADCLGMTVVSGSFGHQVGWTLLDESTFLVDLQTSFELVRLAFEITRPAAIFLPYSTEGKEGEEPTVDMNTCSITLEHETAGEIKIPTPGIYRWSKDYDTLSKEYHEERLDLEGMDIDSLGIDKDTEDPYGKDGQFQKINGVFRCYLGYPGEQPTLFTRRA